MTILNQELGPRYQVTLQQNGPTFRLDVGTAGTGGGNSASGTLDVNIVAATTLNAFRAVGYDGLFTEPNANSLALYAGVTRMAVVAGDPLPVLRIGFLSEDSWNWTPNGAIFISGSGVLTQVAPVSGPLRRIGTAISATTISLDPYPVIVQP